MKRKTMMALSLGIAVLMGAILQIIGGDSKPIEKRFLPELQYGSEKLVSVSIVHPSGELLIHAERIATGWRDKQSGLSVEVMPLANLVQQLAHAKVVAAETSLPRNYKVLGMLAPGEGEGSAWQVSLRADGGYEKNILVGAVDPQRGGQFVRLEGDVSVFVIDRVLGLPDNPLTWFKQ
jgi:hypothetical protein